MGVYDLIIGVLKQAKADYIAALRRNNLHQINKLEKFFLSDYGQAMSLNNGEKIIALCREIAKSKGRTGKVMLKYKGEVKPLVEWAGIVGLDDNVIRSRLRKGWSVERALETPKGE